MRQKLFDDKYVGYHTFGLELNDVTIVESTESTESIETGKDPSPGYEPRNTNT